MVSSGKISKSGINHRLRKLDEIAEQLRFRTICLFKIGNGGDRMVQQKVEVLLKTGLQARPAALFVQEANRFQSDIFLEKGDKKVNAKSIMGLMSLAVSSGSEVTLIADGSDEQDALDALTAYVQEKEAKPL